MNLSRGSPFTRRAAGPLLLEPGVALAINPAAGQCLQVLKHWRRAVGDRREQRDDPLCERAPAHVVSDLL